MHNKVLYIQGFVPLSTLITAHHRALEVAPGSYVITQKQSFLRQYSQPFGNILIST